MYQNISNISNGPRNNLTRFTDNEFNPANPKYETMLQCINSIMPGNVYYSQFINSDLNIQNLLLGDHPILILRYDSNIQKALVVPLTSKNKSENRVNNYVIKVESNYQTGFLLLDQIQTIPVVVNGRFILGHQLYTIPPSSLKQIRDRITKYVLGEISINDGRVDEFRAISAQEKAEIPIRWAVRSFKEEISGSTKIINETINSIKTEMVDKIQSLTYELEKVKLSIYSIEPETTKPSETEEVITNENNKKSALEEILGPSKYVHVAGSRKPFTEEEYLYILSLMNDYKVNDILEYIHIPRGTLYTKLTAASKLYPNVLNTHKRERTKDKHVSDNNQEPVLTTLNGDDKVIKLDALVKKFVEEQCKFHVRSKISYEDIYKAFVEYCNKNSYYIFDEEAFRDEILSQFSDSIRRVKINRNTNGIIGIKIK